MNAQLKSWIDHRLIFLITRIANHIPLGFALALGRGLGSLAPIFARRYIRRISIDIALAYGLDVTSKEVRRIALQSYRFLGECMMEFARLPFMSRESIHQWAHLEGAELVEAALAKGKGVILLTAHLGNWEICGALMGSSGYPTTAIARPQSDSALTEMFTRFRETHGLKIVSMSDVRECIRVLKRNECLGILGDLHARPPSAFVQVFGRPASTYLGTAYLAHLSGATILPVFDERLPDHTHRVRIGAPIPLAETGDKHRDLLATTMRVQEVIEREVRRRPGEWYWLLSRWKIRPEEIEHPERIPMEHRDFTAEEAARIRQWDQEEASALLAINS